MRSALLEVVVLHESDAEAAQEGGADRVALLTRPTDGGLSPEPGVVSTVTRNVDIPVRVMLRLNDSFTTTGGELTRLIGLANDYLTVGAEGLVMGFLDSDLDVDVEVLGTILDPLGEVPWTFHSAFDASLDSRLAWRRVRDLPGIDSVQTAGAALGVEAGQDALLEAARSDPGLAALVLAGRGLDPQHVPWLARAGIRQFHLGPEVRPGRSWDKSYVDASYVRSWRLLLDDEVRDR